ncbi:TIM barrel protein [Calycomorphotria hydatis]|uniref:Hydroxypyruvate isomerase n=1 Tax=Calycomorphotria hydatis TaxID=2528027 RepID=A0A517T6Z3_9PLAN|nr:TIM barrel protein [Calycomorphotria hydatis]QDT64138.1 Hydroxypyruvate isomerase [Calycomorphotria hydatis]
MTDNRTDSALNRRQLLGTTALGMAAGGLMGQNLFAAESPASPGAGRLNQSICKWCYCATGEKWSLDKLCEVTRDLGCTSVELTTPKDWPTLKKYGLTSAIASGSSGSFVRGLNNLRYHDMILSETKTRMDECKENGIDRVIAFTGMKWRDAEDPNSGEIPLAEGRENCIRGLKELAKHAKQTGITVCIEHLNTRDDSHPMKGHPGYMGDDLDWLAEVVAAVDSPHVKLLFDIYHVQIMNGDVVRRIDQYFDLIGHIHTAGNPGRKELDQTQEINYRAPMKKLADLGYEGYVGHEFIPTRDQLTGLTEAVTLCTV